MKDGGIDNWKGLFGNEEVPEDLKKEVFNSLDSLRLFGNIFDLFSDKFVRTESAFLGNPPILDDDETPPNFQSMEDDLI